MSGMSQKRPTDPKPARGSPVVAGEPTDRRFAELVAVLADGDRVVVGEGRGFGAGALTVAGRIFAIPRDGGLVVKLPAERVAELVADGGATTFDAGKGRPMREWAVLAESSGGRWQSLAEESLAFVARSGKRR